MKHLLLTTIAAVVVVGCGPSEADRALVKAAGDGNIVAVKQHLAAGADVNANVDGVTPLHWAETKEIVELLIAGGADVNAKDDVGDTPLDWTIQVRNTELATLLRKHGARRVMN
jgi:ankyrin repeat protein